jgi:hypothetical protein
MLLAGPKKAQAAETWMAETNPITVVQASAAGL